MRWRVAGIVVLITITLGFIGVALLGGNSPDEEVNDTSPVIVSNAQDDIQISDLATDQNSNSWMIFALVALAIATLVSVSISFYLYKWRRILLSQPDRIVPEEWGKYLDNVGRHVKALSGFVEQGMGQVGQETAKNSEQVTKMIETFMTLQKAVDDREEEIKRLKKGYDADVYRKFLNRFIRVDQLVDDYLLDDQESPDGLVQVKRLLVDALDECGVESFHPDIGDDSRKIEGIADSPKTQKTENAEEDFRIVEVIEPGYRLRGGDDYDVLIPAKVRVAVFEG